MNREADNRSKIIEYYDTTQPFYERFWYGKDSLGLHYGFWTPDVFNRQQAIIKENEILAGLSEIKPDDLVLDAGCGVAGSGLWLAREKGAKVVGLNIAHKQLAKGKGIARGRGFSQDMEFIEGDYQVLPFARDAFDVVWSLESIEHATDVDQFVREAYRVLKPGGRIVIAGTFKGREELSDEETKKMRVGLAAAGAFNDFKTASRVFGIVEEAGFIDVKNIDQTGLVMPSSHEMTAMCRWGLPTAKILSALHLVSPILTLNNQWGMYQEGLFRSGATSYNVLLAKKPSHANEVLAD